MCEQERASVSSVLFCDIAMDAVTCRFTLFSISYMRQPTTSEPFAENKGDMLSNRFASKK